MKGSGSEENHEDATVSAGSMTSNTSLPNDECTRMATYDNLVNVTTSQPPHRCCHFHPGIQVFGRF